MSGQFLSVRTCRAFAVMFTASCGIVILRPFYTDCMEGPGTKLLFLSILIISGLYLRTHGI
jgi:hypothetical protein